MKITVLLLVLSFIVPVTLWITWDYMNPEVRVALVTGEIFLVSAAIGRLLTGAGTPI